MLSESILPRTQPEEAARRLRGGRLARPVVLAALRRIKSGMLEVHDGSQCHHFGEPAASAELRASVTVLDPRFYRALACGGTLGAGQAYIDGWWSCTDLTALMRLVLRNEQAFDGLNGLWSWLSAAATRGWHMLHFNSRRGSRRNIAAHYDLGNDFYRLFLDHTMTYSCGIFERPGATMAEASTAKLDRICRKLALSPADHVLEIGTGWGSFAIHAAGRYGCRVTTTTISREQYRLARERVAAAGLEDRVTVLADDYRDLRGRHDKLVSIEMIEAIGWRQYPTYFRKCSDLLKPDGVACIQAITMADRYYDQARRRVDFIKRFVFPGSCIPSIGAMAQAVARSTDLTIGHIEDITPHYAATLRAWYTAFQGHLPRVRALGLSESFIRLWEYYLCYCEAGFQERVIGDVQMMLYKPGFRGGLPLGVVGGQPL